MLPITRRLSLPLAAALALSLATPATSQSVNFSTHIPDFGDVSLQIDPVSPSRRSGGLQGLDGLAIGYTMRLMQDWSLPGNQGAHAMQQFYGNSVSFYGKHLSYDQVIDERYAFADRWPERDYRIDPASVRVSCDRVCTVSAEYEFFAYNPWTGAQSSGVSTLDLTLSPRDNSFVITREGGHVLERF